MAPTSSTVSTLASLQGKVAVVTGGTQGLGAAIAHLLAERGARAVVICGRNRDKGQAQVERIRQTGAQALYVPAAITDRGTLLDTSPELFDRMFAINVRAPFFLMQEAVSVMRREKIEGNIVNIGSMSAMAGQPFLAAYCTSKGALATLTRNTAYGLLRNRIRVNGLNIGWMASEGEDRIQREFHKADADWLEQVSASQPFGRLVDPKEVARAVAFLCTAESGLMTGSVIEYDQSIWGAYDGSPHPVSPM